MAVDWTKKAQALFDSMRLSFMRANKRMLRIERYSDPTNVKGEHREKYNPAARTMKDYAYRIAQRAIKALKGETETRFTEKFKASSDPERAKAQYKALKAQQRAAETFLESASSTLKKVGSKQGLLDVYDKRTNTINERYVTKYGLEGFTQDELTKFFQSAKFAKLKDSDWYNEMFAVGAVVKQMPTKKKDLADYLAHHIDIDKLTDQDLKDADILDKDQALDILVDANKIGDLRKLMQFAEFTDSELLNEHIAEAITDLKLTPKNLFY